MVSMDNQPVKLVISCNTLFSLQCQIDTVCVRSCSFAFCRHWSGSPSVVATLRRLLSLRVGYSCFGIAPLTFSLRNTGLNTSGLNCPLLTKSNQSHSSSLLILMSYLKKTAHSNLLCSNRSNQTRSLNHLQLTKSDHLFQKVCSYLGINNIIIKCTTIH